MQDKIKKILIIGSGPNTIGHSTEYDQATVEAIRAFKERGISVVVLDANASAFATNPAIADSTYIQPLTPASVSKVIEKEKPDAVYACAGGTTALNLLIKSRENGAINGCPIIGISDTALDHVENPALYRETANTNGIIYPITEIAESIQEGIDTVRRFGFPAVIKPIAAEAGAGCSIVYNIEELVPVLTGAFASSSVGKAAVTQNLSGFKEVEIVSLRGADGVSHLLGVLENIEPVGVHGGDSAVVMPQMTISTKTAEVIISASNDIGNGIDICGVYSIRFAIDENSGRFYVISVCPIFGRSAALVSASLGYPVAYNSALASIGVDIADAPRPQAGYVTVRLPMFEFSKFPRAMTTLGATMKSTGEVVAIGKSFVEAYQKAVNSLDGCYALPENADIFYAGESAKIDEFADGLRGMSLVSVSGDTLRQAKAMGFSDSRLAYILETDEDQVRVRRNILGIRPTLAKCGNTGTVLYCTYEHDDQFAVDPDMQRVVLLSGGPSGIDRGAGFDYSLEEACAAATELGYRPVVITCDASSVFSAPRDDKEIIIAPPAFEDILAAIEAIKPESVLAQFGGRKAFVTGLSLLGSKINVLGITRQTVEITGKTRLRSEVAKRIDIKEPAGVLVSSPDEGYAKAEEMGFPLLARAYGASQSSDIVYDSRDVEDFLKAAFRQGSQKVLLETFLEEATGVDVDAISDGKLVFICGVMEHIEEAGVHSGDSAFSLPPYSLPDSIIDKIKQSTGLLAHALDARGLINAKFAVKDDEVYLLAVSPAASRSIPFVSKASGVPWAEVAAKVLLGESLEQQGITGDAKYTQVAVKEAVFSFARFPGVDVVLGPVMRSTGEVMGVNSNFGSAYMKAQLCAGQDLPRTGSVFISVSERDKEAVGEIGAKLVELGFKIIATKGTAEALEKAGVESLIIPKIGEGRPDAVDMIKNSQIDLVINTPSGKRSRQHEVSIRSTVVAGGIPIVTTIAGAKATVYGMEAEKIHGVTFKSLQESQDWKE